MNWIVIRRAAKRDGKEQSDSISVGQGAIRGAS
jgi:hypothetical protein